MTIAYMYLLSICSNYEFQVENKTEGCANLSSSRFLVLEHEVLDVSIVLLSIDELVYM